MSLDNPFRGDADGQTCRVVSVGFERSFDGHNTPRMMTDTNGHVSESDGLTKRWVETHPSSIGTINLRPCVGGAAGELTIFAFHIATHETSSESEAAGSFYQKNGGVATRPVS